MIHGFSSSLLLAALLVTQAAFGAPQSVASHGDGPSVELAADVHSWDLAGPVKAVADTVIVFTANQGLLSRIYVLERDGRVRRHFEYAFYAFSDLEVVDDEVYAVDWVAPRLYKVDIDTGDLEVIIDDWSLLSMYDVAFDGTYFYCNEWSLNRYDLTGHWDDSTSFPGSHIRGGAWDGIHYWTMDDGGQMRCWDLDGWPQVEELPELAFSAPSGACRGLWFDGQHFWTAESLEDLVGRIYRFDHEGAVVESIRAPAYRGYAAALTID